ncbi:MAG: hypothetical protein V3S68_05580 [Dehalococcoidia bacterium]
MFWLKSCPRCHGDLQDKTDIYGSYIDCFQCGHYLTVDEDTRLRSENPHGKASFLALAAPTKALAKMTA